jgi:hypothetical protein
LSTYFQIASECLESEYFATDPSIVTVVVTGRLVTLLSIVTSKAKELELDIPL